MKKILSILFIGIISILVVPFSVNAKSISTLNVTSNNNKLTVSGKTENGVLAVAVLVYSKEDLIHMETCSSNNNYSCELSKTFPIGNYTIKVADYNGGDYISKDISVGVKEETPNTYDGISRSFIIGGVCIIGILECGYYLKKKNSLKHD